MGGGSERPAAGSVRKRKRGPAPGRPGERRRAGKKQKKTTKKKKKKYLTTPPKNKKKKKKKNTKPGATKSQTA
ncbi:hypothetical protein, partial [Streptomyces sindenensis]